MGTTDGSRIRSRRYLTRQASHWRSSVHGPTSRSASWRKSFQTLYQASFRLREPLGLKKWFDGFLRTARDVLHVDRLTILLADPESQWLQAVASTESETTPEVIRVPIAPAGGGLAHAFQTQQAITCDGRAPVKDEDRLKPPYDRYRGIPIARLRDYAAYRPEPDDRRACSGLEGKPSVRPGDPGTVAVARQSGRRRQRALAPLCGRPAGA